MSARKSRKLKRRLNRKFAKKLRAMGATERDIQYGLDFKNRMGDCIYAQFKGRAVAEVDPSEIYDSVMDFLEMEDRKMEISMPPERERDSFALRAMYDMKVAIPEHPAVLVKNVHLGDD